MKGFEVNAFVSIENLQTNAHARVKQQIFIKPENSDESYETVNLKNSFTNFLVRDRKMKDLIKLTFLARFKKHLIFRITLLMLHLFSCLVQCRRLLEPLVYWHMFGIEKLLCTNFSILKSL